MEDLEKERAEQQLLTSKRALDEARAERAAAETTAAEQASLLESLLESMAEGVVALDAAGTQRIWNRAARSIVGRGPSSKPRQVRPAEYGVYRPDEVTLWQWDETPLALAVRGEASDGVEMFIRHEGAPLGVWVDVNARPWRDQHGAILGGVAVFRDVTAEKQARRAAAQSEHTFRAMLDALPDGVAIRRGVEILYVNQALVEALGCAHAGELVGKSNLDFVHPDDRGAATALMEAQDAEARVAGFEVRMLRKDGSVATLEGSLAQDVVFDGVAAKLRVLRDITERKKLQAQLLVSDRMASVGLLAAGVAHEINNPLAAVMGNLELALEAVGRLPDGTNDRLLIESELRDALEAADRVRRIVRDLKIFARSEDEAARSVDVHGVLDSSLRMAWNEIRHRSRVVRDYGTVPAVWAAESRLGQVFLNLLVNAAQAIPEGNADAHEIRITTSVDARGRVVIAVKDSGGGVACEDLERLFSPFFTTKAVGGGMGLGLAICHRIVTALGGEIDVESHPGAGAVFRVALPASSESPTAPNVEPPAKTVERRGRILVIDDEPMLGKTMARALGAQHEVVLTTSATDALQRIEAGERFDVILCDLMMPLVTGMDFHRLLMLEAPEHVERVVFLTGGAFRPSGRAFLDSVPNTILEKPVDIRKLLALVNERLS